MGDEIKRELVFCSHCIHYCEIRVVYTKESTPYCDHPNFIQYVNSPIERRKYYGNCTEINKNNDCPYFYNDIFRKVEAK